MSSAIFRASYNREVHKNYSILLVNYEFTFMKSQGKLSEWMFRHVEVRFISFCNHNIKNLSP